MLDLVGSELVVIANTGDDVEIYGAHVSPDPDLVLYWLADRIDERGWGLRGDTFAVMEGLREVGVDVWFQLGDRDLAVGLLRRQRLEEGARLAEALDGLRRAFGVAARVVPMSDQPVRTRVAVDGPAGPEDLGFQEWWVGRQARDPVRHVYFDGIERARPAPGLLEAIAGAVGILLCPSNPVVSIAPILAVPGLRDAVESAGCRKVAVTPIVGGAPVRGMADRLLPAWGVEVSARGVAGLYEGLVDAFVLDVVDAGQAADVEAMGLRPVVVPTLMHTVEDAAALAKAALGAL
jgi:LPPG:FO 2-phospho-L-lactate transferase